MKVILRHQGRWLRFSEPLRTLRAQALDEVLPLLKDAVSSGYYAAGFVSYEAAPAFDTALSTHASPDFPLLCFGLFESPDVIDDARLDNIGDQPPGAYTVGELKASVSRHEYIDAISKIRTQLAEGATYQVNYTYRLRADFTGDTWSFFRELVSGQKAGHAAYIECGDFAICSASPELFFSVSDGWITSRPMKGTERRGRTLLEDRQRADALHESIKNRAENIMIVDMIRNDIGRIAKPGSVEVLSRFDVEKYPTLWQMTSTVSGFTDQPVDAVWKALFPCASITGAPKAKTMEIIQELETTPRKIYTGSIGFVSPGGEASFNVAIRTALVDKQNNRLEFGVGGGIVWDSRPRDEYEETLTKARVLTQPRPSFDLLETILWEPGKGLFLLERHLQRLRDSATYFDIPVDASGVDKKLEKTTRHLSLKPHRLRLLVSQAGEITTEAFELALEPEEPARLALAGAPVDREDIFLFHKTTHREAYDAAKADFPDHDDVVLWNEDGEVTETCIANLVIRKGDRLLTPPVECGLLAGTFRAELLDNGDIEEEVIRIGDLKRATEIFLVNSVRGWRRAVLNDG